MMRGGFEHNELLIQRLDQAFQEAGGKTQREVFIRRDGIVGFADLLMHLNSKRIIIEVERSARRISQDLLKAMALQADELWFVVPTPCERNAVRRKLTKLGICFPQSGIHLLTLGQALQRVKSYLPLIAGS